MLRALYAPLQLSGERVVVTDPRSSELTKYAANTMLAMRVSFMNELARLCHATGADMHAGPPRRGQRHANRQALPLCRAPATAARAFRRTFRRSFIWAARTACRCAWRRRRTWRTRSRRSFSRKLVERAVGTLQDKTIAFWGLAFKPETDDIREAPSLKLATALLAQGARVVGHDPEAGRNFARAMASHGARVKVVDRDYDALDGAHALVLLTEWRSYRAPNFAEIRKRLRDADGGAPPIVVDARNMWRAERRGSRGAALPGDRRADARGPPNGRRRPRRADRADRGADPRHRRRRVHRLPRDARSPRAGRRRRRRRRFLRRALPARRKAPQRGRPARRVPPACGSSGAA